MVLQNNDKWINQIDYVLSSFTLIDEMKGKSILITGASGLIGSSITDLLIRFNETHETKIEIYACGRSCGKMRDRFGEYAGKDYFHFVQFNTADIVYSDLPYSDFIIHGAGNATPDLISAQPVETMVSNFHGMYSLLEHAKSKHVGKICYISSSEIYGERKECTDKPFKESDKGSIDHMNTRNSYSISKLATETLCLSAVKEWNMNVVIARPGHIYGPCISPEDKRVSAQWIVNAAQGEKIIMKSSGTKIRSYCHCLDCATALLTILLRGSKGEAYNISNPDSVISIKDMGMYLARAGRADFLIEEEKQENEMYNTMTNSSLDSGKLLALGWKGCFDAEHGFQCAVDVLKNGTKSS